MCGTVVIRKARTRSHDFEECNLVSYKNMLVVDVGHVALLRVKISQCDGEIL